VRMSLSDGGDVGFEDAEAGGMRARLAGRDVVMIESSPSPSSMTDDGRGDPSRESGLSIIGVGECPRIRAFGILPAYSPTSRRPMGLPAGAANRISCRLK